MIRHQVLWLSLLTACGSPRGLVPQIPDNQPSIGGLHPGYVTGGLRTFSWGEHRAAYCGGHVYASNGADVVDDLALAEVVLTLLRSRGLMSEPIALVSIGSGRTLSELLSAGLQVDLYEPNTDLLESARFVADGDTQPQDGFETTVLRHPNLRVNPPLGTRYGAIVHSNSLSVLAPPQGLFDVERLRSLQDHLRPDGFVTLFTQFYEIRPLVLQRLLASAHAALGEVVLIANQSGEENLSSGTLVASEQPVRIDVALPSERESSLAVAARTLLWGDSTLQFVAGAPPLSAANPLGPGDWLRRPPQESFELDDSTWGDAMTAFSDTHNIEALQASIRERLLREGPACPELPCAVIVHEDQITSDEFLVALLRAGRRIPTEPRTGHSGALLQYLTELPALTLVDLPSVGTTDDHQKNCFVDALYSRSGPSCADVEFGELPRAVLALAHRPSAGGAEELLRAWEAPAVCDADWYRLDVDACASYLESYELFSRVIARAYFESGQSAIAVDIALRFVRRSP